MFSYRVLGDHCHAVPVELFVSTRLDRATNGSLEAWQVGYVQYEGEYGECMCGGSLTHYTDCCVSQDVGKQVFGTLLEHLDVIA